VHLVGFTIEIEQNIFPGDRDSRFYDILCNCSENLHNIPKEHNIDPIVSVFLFLFFFFFFFWHMWS